MKKILRHIILFTIIFSIGINFNTKTYANSTDNSIKNIKERGYITVATNAEFPPFEYLEGSEILGIDIELSKKVAEKLGVELKIKNAPFTSLILMLQNGMCDFVAAGLSYDAERANNVDFSNAYMSGAQKIVVLKDSAIKNENDLIRKKVGVQIGTTADTYCSQNKEMETIRLSKPADAILALLNKQVDAVVVDEFSANNFINNNAEIKMLSQNLTKEDYNIAVLKGNSELLNIINQTIAELKSNNGLNNIVSNYVVQPQSENKFCEYASYIFKGLRNTIIMTFFAAIIGIILGILVAAGKNAASHNKKLRFLGVITNIYTTIIRGTPALIQLFIIYYGITSRFRIENIDIIAAILAFGLNSGAYVSEHVRAGISSVNKGQLEAGRSLGLSYKTTMTKIIIPQAIRNILPSLGSEFITLLKETAVASYIGIIDLSRAGDIIISKSYDAFLPLFAVAAIYLVMIVGLTALLNKFERRLKNDLH